MLCPECNGPLDGPFLCQRCEEAVRQDQLVEAIRAGAARLGIPLLADLERAIETHLHTESHWGYIGTTMLNDGHWTACSTFTLADAMSISIGEFGSAYGSWWEKTCDGK